MGTIEGGIEEQLSLEFYDGMRRGSQHINKKKTDTNLGGPILLKFSELGRFASFDGRTSER